MSPQQGTPWLGGATGWLNSEPLGPADLRGRVVLVEDETDAEPEQRLELVFFLRTWALSHPELAFEVRDAI